MVQGFPLQLAEKVRARRTSLKLNQQDVADMAGVSERFVRFVEQGKPSIQLDSLLAVLETLGLELKLATQSREAAHALVPHALVPQPPSTEPPSTEPPSAVQPSAVQQRGAAEDSKGGSVDDQP
jgi:HTH-type transcriptional regulator/antitoxin HipB